MTAPASPAVPNAPDGLPALEGGITRELLMSGVLREQLAKMMPDMRLTTEAERAESLRAILDRRPEHGDGIWVFAYGSLIWNPAILISGRRIATAVGWHRSFCLSVRMGRGSPENPGAMLGLRPTGRCPGVVLRVAESDIAHELDLLWRREMVADGYIPHWVPVEDETGADLGAAIAFTINPTQDSYCGDLPEDEIVQRLATARGRLGSGAEYLFNTRDGLAAMGVVDPYLERLAAQVAARMDDSG
jgi:cation transport protein ChaC